MTDLTPGAEDFCDGCKSRTTQCDYDGACNTTTVYPPDCIDAPDCSLLADAEYDAEYGAWRLRYDAAYAESRKAEAEWSRLWPMRYLESARADYLKASTAFKQASAALDALDDEEPQRRPRTLPPLADPDMENDHRAFIAQDIDAPSVDKEVWGR